MADTPGVGDGAPEFALRAHHGGIVALTSLTARGPILVAFYPDDKSSAAAKGLSALRDASQALRDAGCETVAIGRGTVESHALLAGRLRLPFALLVDTDGATAKRWGVTRASLGGARATFLVDEKGVVRFAQHERLPRSRDRTAEILLVLQEIRRLGG